MTAREHYIAHLLLAKIYNDWNMTSAVTIMMTTWRGKREFRFNSKLYEKLRQEHGRKMSAKWKGVKKTPEQVKKHADAIRGRKHPPRSDEWRRNLSLANKDKKQPWVSERNKGNKYGLGKHPNKGTYYYNNGVVEVRRVECPEGFVKGRLKNGHHKSETICQEHH